MAATVELNPSYDVRVHRRAEAELTSVPADVRDRLTYRIKNASEHREPCHARHVEPLQNHDGFYRVRVTHYRAIIALRKPRLLVLLVGDRDNIYSQKMSTAKDRYADAATP